MPKKLAVFFLLFFLASPTPPVFAAFKGGNRPLPMHAWPGGFTDPDIARMSVSQARVAKPDTPVIVRGNILQHVGMGRYVFKDATSSILVDIAEDSWRGLDVTPENTVELEGSLRQSANCVRIRVARLTKVE